MGWDVIGRLLWVMSTSRDPERPRARIGHWALAAPTMPEAARRKVIEARLPASDWPATALKVTAVDARTGQFVVFDATGEASLVDAVGATARCPACGPRSPSAAAVSWTVVCARSPTPTWPPDTSGSSSWARWPRAPGI